MNLKSICGIAAIALAFSFARADDPLRFYASFDSGFVPEIALDGTKVIKIPEPAPLKIEGKFGGALAFRQNSGVGDLWYSLGSAMPDSGWTVSFWINPDKTRSGDKHRSVFRTNFGWNSGNVYVQFDRWGKLNATYIDENKNYRGLDVSEFSFPAGEWTHAALVYDGKGMKLFINGNEAVYNRNDGGKIGAPQRELEVGAMTYSASDQLDGGIDEFKIYNRPLTQPEIAEAMNSTPGKKRTDAFLYVPFEGKIDPREGASFQSAETIFTAGRFGKGIKMSRHGYDRKAVASLTEVSGMSARAQSYMFYFIPDWDGSCDKGIHGLLDGNSGSLNFSIIKSGNEAVFELSAGGKSDKISLPASIFKKGESSKICFGFDFKSKKFYASIDSRKEEKPISFDAPGDMGAGRIIIGDTRGSDTYSKTQAEGVIDELTACPDYLDPSMLTKVRKAQSKKSAAARGAKLKIDKLRDSELPLWALNGAETENTPTRRKIVLNALWRLILPASGDAGPYYLPVPGRFSGWENGHSDAEFRLRDKNLKKLHSRIKIGGKPLHEYTEYFLERAFIADKSWRGNDVSLTFSEFGMSQSAEVYFNGKKVAEFSDGFDNEIVLDDSDLRYGDWNFITVKLDDEGGRWNWRGIKSDVFLEVKPKTKIMFPAVRTFVKDGKIIFEATVKNNTGRSEKFALRVTVEGENAPADLKSQLVEIPAGAERKISFSAPWENAKLWDVDSPYMYSCRMELIDKDGKVADSAQPFKFGFRTFEIVGKDYVLNGKKIHLFNHDSWGNCTATYEETLKTAKALKSLGYNSARGLFPVDAKDSRFENIIRACDEEGILLFVCLKGVTAKSYTLWNDPKTRVQLEKYMASAIRKWRNHPSNVMYFLSTNFLGYGLDYHPLKMADGYLPSGDKKRKAQVCLNGVKIMRKYDPDRPYFFQAGGNFGEVITSNAYFCWWPQAEKNAWPQEWAKIGKKPLHIIETSFPYASSYFGMDRFGGNRPLFVYENAARYFGSDAYKSPDPDLLEQTAISAKGGDARTFHDIGILQKLKSRIISETIKYWRGFDMSGISPFAELYFAFARHASPRLWYETKNIELDQKDFRSEGVHPDVIKMPYLKEFDQEKPLPASEALKGALAPFKAFIGGTREEPADQSANYFEGSTVSRIATVINDTRKDSGAKVSWTAFDGNGAKIAENSQTLKLAPAEVAHIPIEFKLPQSKADGEYFVKLSAETDAGMRAEDEIKIKSFARQPAKSAVRCALFGSNKESADALSACGVEFSDASQSGLDGMDVLVVARDCLDDKFFIFASENSLAKRVNSGKLSVLVLEQKPELLKRVGLKAAAIYSRNVFPTSLPLPQGLSVEDFSNWKGDGTHAPSKPIPEISVERENNVPSPFWHWKNLNTVSAYPILRPVLGNYKISLVCGMDLAYSPLFFISSGRGFVAFCQLEVSGRCDEPAALRILRATIDALPKMRAPAASAKFVDSSNLSASELAAKISNGGVAVIDNLDEKAAAALNINIGAPKKISSFELLGSAKKYWSALDARDTFLRVPQEMGDIGGDSVVALTNPAFAAEKRIGAGKIILLNFPKEPLKYELEAGQKLGADSSHIWSALALRSRFIQMKNLAEAELGKQFPKFADRLENPEAEFKESPHFPYTADPFPLYNTESHIRW